jgi:hypothetical protein
VSVPSLTRFKVCTKCKCTKPATPTFFRKYNRNACGLHAACKGCDVAYRRINREAIAERNRVGHLANREHRLALMARYRAEHKEEIAAQQQRYQQENRDKLRAYYRRWRKNNRDVRRAHERKRQAAKKGQAGFRDANELWEMYHDQNELCAYCETPLFGDFHVDHMLPLSRGGIDGPENYAITCPPCNMAKHSKTAEEFMNRRQG